MKRAGGLHAEFGSDGELLRLHHASDESLAYVDVAVTEGAAFGAIGWGHDAAGPVIDGWTVSTDRGHIERRAEADGIHVAQTWSDEDGVLRFTTRLSGSGLSDIEGVRVAIPFATRYVRDPRITYRERVVRHDEFMGTAGYLYVNRADGGGPFLVVSAGEAGCRVDGVIANMDDRASGWEGAAWLWIKSTPTDGKLELSLRFDEALSHQGVRDVLARTGSLDVVVTPGLVIPADLTARVAVRGGSGQIDLIAPDGDAEIGRFESRSGYVIFSVRLLRTGEVTIVARDGAGRERPIRMFSCHPLEELLVSRRDFLVERQQYRGDAWYDGLFSNWDMPSRQLTTPDRRLGLDPYMVGGSDDPTLCKAPLLAELSSVAPDQASIEAIDYYINRFVVGGLQRVEEAPHSYGVYGTPNWYELRHAATSTFSNGGYGREHLWRTFDYPHLVQLYVLMSRISRHHPALDFARSPDEYLTLAARTALAYFEVPYNILMDGWAINGFADWAYKQGNFHETRILDVIEDLDATGRGEEAQAIREHWQAKVRYMLFDHPHPFGSEMYFDSTAFESTYVVGRYALDEPPSSDGVGWYDRNANGPGQGAFRPHPDATIEQAESFLASQARANMAARGVVESTWYVYGSDIRQHGTTSYMISYMTALGGGPLLEWGLRYGTGDDATTAVRAGYAAYLATYALVHSGADYPWWPDEANRGAAAWAFAPLPDTTWMGRRVERGPWPVDGEIDSGLSGAIRAARCVVMDDPVFGLIALGGELSVEGSVITLEPRDGVRQRLEVCLGGDPQLLDVAPRRIRRATIDRSSGAINVEFDPEN